MCKVLDYREARGRELGINEGIAQGITQGITQGEAITLVKLVDNYIKKTGASLIAACDIHDVTVDEYNEARKLTE